MIISYTGGFLRKLSLSSQTAKVQHSSPMLAILVAELLLFRVTGTLQVFRSSPNLLSVCTAKL